MTLTEKQMERLAFYDYLTGLPNRVYMKYNDDSIINMVKKKGFAAFIFIDIDNFRSVNDTLGHTVGDSLVLSVASELNNFLDEGDELFHLSIDKFLLLSVNNSSELETAGLVYDIVNKLKKSFNVKGYDFYITVSIGVSLYPIDGQDIGTLLTNVDIAVNNAKATGKNNYKFFTTDMHKKIIEKVKLEKELRDALENNELTVFYQPKVDVFTGKIHSMEALVRWNHPEKGLISPGKFIPIAEETGMIIEIGQQVMKKACMQNKMWQDAGYTPIPVAVNLSVKQLNSNGFVNSVKKILRDTQLNTKWLELEITESLVIENFKKSEEILCKLRSLGITISLDDFGTGYSSLNYLKSLPINYIKIDKSFIDDIVQNKKQSFITSALINLAHGIGIKVIVEGVEYREQFELLKQYGCDIIQGYLFSKPVPVYEIESMLKNNIKFKI